MNMHEELESFSYFCSYRVYMSEKSPDYHHQMAQNEGWELVCCQDEMKNVKSEFEVI